MNIDYNKEDLDTYINIQKLTYKTIGKLYGVSGNAIKKAAKRLGVYIPVRRNINLEESFNKVNLKIKIVQETIIGIINIKKDNK